MKNTLGKMCVIEIILSQVNVFLTTPRHIYRLHNNISLKRFYAVLNIEYPACKIPETLQREGTPKFIKNDPLKL